LLEGRGSGSSRGCPVEMRRIDSGRERKRILERDHARKMNARGQRFLLTVERPSTGS
jgi:hypothetical protein